MRNQAQVKTWKASALPPDWFKRQASDGKISEQIENDVKAIIGKVVKKVKKIFVKFT